MALRRRWAATGRPFSEFWTLTPAEVAIAFGGADDRARAEMEIAAWSAWHTAALMRVSGKKRFPRLADMLPKVARARSPKRGAAADLWKAVVAANAILGGDPQKPKG